MSYYCHWFTHVNPDGLHCKDVGSFTQCSTCKHYSLSGNERAHYPVPAIYSGPNNPSYWVIGWLSWAQAKEYVALHHKYGTC